MCGEDIPVRLHVKSLTGPSYTVDMHWESTMDDVANVVELKTGIPADRMCLLYDGATVYYGEVWANSRGIERLPSVALADVPVPSGATLHLILEMRGD